MKNRKLKAIIGVSLAVMLAVPVSVFGISGAFGSSPKAQQSQTTASPLGLNPETDPVIMTTDYGLEIKLGGAPAPSPDPDPHYDLITNGWAYFTTTGDAGSVNWVIIGYNNVTSNVGISGSGITEETIEKEIKTTETETAYTIDTFDKYASIRELSEDDEYKREKPDPHSGSLSQSPITYDPNDPIMSAIANDPVTWYQINYTHEVTTTTTTSVKTYNFPHAKSPANGDVYNEIPEGCVLVISECLLFSEWFKDTNSSGNMYSSGYKLYDAMNAIANSISYTRGVTSGTHVPPTVCDYGLKDLGLYNESTNPTGKIMPQILYTNYYDGGTKSNTLTNQYVFPLAGDKFYGRDSGVPQSFMVDNYFSASEIVTGYESSGDASTWWTRSSGYHGTDYGSIVTSFGSFSDETGGNWYANGVRPAFVLKI